VAGCDDPQALSLVGFAPQEVGGSAHQPPEDLRVVAGMQHDQTHAVQHMLLHAVDNGIGDLVVGQVPPPDQHVGLLQHGFGQAMLRLVERSSARVYSLLAQEGGNRAVNAGGIDGGNLLIPLFVAVFVPHRDADCAHRRSSPQEQDRRKKVLLLE